VGWIAVLDPDWARTTRPSAIYQVGSPYPIIAQATVASTNHSALMNSYGHCRVESKGNCTMDSPSANVESELIDVGRIPLKVLRALNDPALHRALQHVVEQTAIVRVTEQHGSARID